MSPTRGFGGALAVAAFIAALSAVPGFAQSVDLDVLANVSPDDTLYFEGTVTAGNLLPPGHLQVQNDLDVFVEFIEDGGRFCTLPDRYQATSDQAWKGRRELDPEERDGVKSQTVTICGQAIVPEDERVPFGVSGTVSMAGAQRFRIIARLRHTWVGVWPAAECSYSVAGPFAVKAGVARERQGGGLLGDVGRFLERSVCDIGEGILGTAGQILGGGGTPLGLVQALLLNDVSDRSGALGEALSYIGANRDTGWAMQTQQQILGGSGGTVADLTASVVSRLLAKFAGGDLASGTLPTVELPGQAEVERAAGRITQDLVESLGLRGVNVGMEGGSVVVTSDAPNLQGHGHLEPIAAYMLVNGALNAPWAERVVALFDGSSGGTFGIEAPVEVIAQYARGELDTASFLTQCLLTDAAGLSAAQQQPPPDATASSGWPAQSAPPATAASGGSRPLLSQAQLPPGWVASATQELSPQELAQSLPGFDLSAHAIVWSGVQVVNVEDVPVTLLGMQLTDADTAYAFLGSLAQQAGASPPAGSEVALPTDPPVQALQYGPVVMLITGDSSAVTQVAGLFTGAPSAGTAPAAAGTQVAQTPAAAQGTQAQDTGAATPQPPPQPQAPAQPGGADSGGQTPTAPAATTQPPPAPQTEPVEPPDPVPLGGDGLVREAVLCTGVSDDGEPVLISDPLGAGAEKVGVYVSIVDAPSKSEVRLRWYHEGRQIGRRLLVVTGSHRTVNFISSRMGGALTSGSYWLEIFEDDELAARLCFSVQ